MKKTAIYIYPITARFKEGTYNPYIDQLIEALEPYYTCINKNKPSRIGTFNMVIYFLPSRYFFLNWIEDLPDKKGGLIQTWFFILMLLLMKATGKKIVWTIHNQFPHNRKRIRLKKWLTRFLMKYSDYKITHSKEGIEFTRRITNECVARKVNYLPHPVIPRVEHDHFDTKYDVLIWGTIAKYKGIDLFMKYLWNNHLQDKYSILIMGKILNETYRKELKHLESNTIRIVDTFASKKQLEQAIGESRIILFTYRNQHVLSSGALTDSLAYAKNIMGPHVGAFKDLEALGLVTTYLDFNDMVSKIDQLLKEDSMAVNRARKNFIADNTWDRFGTKVHKLIRQGKEKRAQWIF